VPIRDNKLARRAQERAKNKNLVDEQPTVEEQLVRLADDLRRLKIEFDIYFNGGAKRPPYDTKSRVETLIKRLGDDRTLTYAQRFHYNSLATRYTAFRDLWRRIMQGREEGRDAVTAARSAAHLGTAAVPLERVSFVCNDARRDVQTVKSLYDALVEAKRNCGESTENMSFPRFHRLIASKAEGLKEKLGCASVQFSIGVEEGRVNFRAKGYKE
jgi:hypothetical protein